MVVVYTVESLVPIFDFDFNLAVSWQETQELFLQSEGLNRISAISSLGPSQKVAGREGTSPNSMSEGNAMW